MNTYIPEGYKSLLGVYDTQKAIGLLKRLFEDQLAAKLNLFRVSAPLFLEEASGLNDNLNGYERPVLFDIPQAGKEAQVVQSLAKWKRMALHRYDFYRHERHPPRRGCARQSALGLRRSVGLGKNH